MQSQLIFKIFHINITDFYDLQMLVQAKFLLHVALCHSNLEPQSASALARVKA